MTIIEKNQKYDNRRNYSFGFRRGFRFGQVAALREAGFKCSEISEKTGISEDSVGSIILRLDAKEPEIRFGLNKVKDESEES